MALRGRFDADFGHRVAEFQPVLGAVDDLGLAPISSTPWRASAPFAASCIAVLSAVWPPMVGSSASGFSRAMIFSTISGRDRLDVGGVGEAGVGHDGGGVGVHQDDAIALGLQRLAGLRAGIVELAGLADDDRAGADDQDGVDVGALGHGIAVVRRAWPAIAACVWRRRRRRGRLRGRDWHDTGYASVSVPDASGIAARLPAGGSARGSGRRAGKPRSHRRTRA